MNINDKDYQELFAAVDRALRHFEGRPVEPGFDRDVYDELRRVRETMARTRRDLHDPNLKETGSQSPS